MRVQEALAAGAAQLQAAGIDGAARDARRLMAAAMGISPDRITLHLRDALDDITRLFFFKYIDARIARKPVSHIIGGRQFYGRWFIVSEAVLDPRPETETLIEQALEQPFSRVLDLGTGSGCILLTLLAERDRATGTGADLSPQALAVARRNAEALDLSGRVEFHQSDWFGAVEGQFDLIVSNPPYIPADKMARLDPEVRDYEPRMALTDEADGLAAYRIIAAGAGAHLAPGGRLMVEISPRRGPAVARMFQAAGLTDIRILPDLDGRDRVVVGNANEGNQR